ncbi:MAG: CpaF family protein, partial [Nitrosospira sp.]|nr:CpaF family protein [Nitrosospira sp.]
MSIRDRLQSVKQTEAAGQNPAPVTALHHIPAYQELKARVHQKLIDRMDLTVVESLPPERLLTEIKNLVERLLVEESTPINEAERQCIVREIQNEVLGLGPLEPLLADPTISDILVNSHRQVYVERRGRLEMTDTHFDDEGHLRKIIDRIVSHVGRRVDES